MKFKIIADSSADSIKLKEVPFSSAPLKIITNENEYIDNADLYVVGMITDLKSYSGKSSTSCPSVSDWLMAFEDGDIEIYPARALCSFYAEKGGLLIGFES